MDFSGDQTQPSAGLVGDSLENLDRDMPLISKRAFFSK